MTYGIYNINLETNVLVKNSKDIIIAGHHKF